MLSVVLLGERRLLADGRDLGAMVQYRKGWALLGYLAVEHGRRHAREHLAELLWPALPPIAARTNLRQVVANLNRIFESQGIDDALQARRDDVGLFPHPQVELDVHAIERMAECSVDELLAIDDRIDPCGEFLAGLSVDDCPAFEPWLQAERARLATASARALRRLFEAQHGAGLSRKALATARRLSALDPWDEWAVRHGMTLLALDGQHAEALAAYERLAATLRRDLGTAPAPATAALHEAIRAALDAGTPFTAMPPTLLRPASRHWACGVIVRVDGIDGPDREALLAEVSQRLHAAGARPLFATRDTAYTCVVAEGEPGELDGVAAHAARAAAALRQAFDGRIAIVLAPALVQVPPTGGLALVGNPGEWAAHLLPHARVDAVLVCESLFGNLFEAFALHPHADVAQPEPARPLRIWRLGAEGVSTADELAERALAEAARPAPSRGDDDDPASRSSLLTLRLADAPPEDALAATAWLTVVAGADRGKRAGIADRPIVIGRSSDSDLQLPRRTVSRYHCVVWREADHYRLRDLGATNRTLLNGGAVRDARLSEGDRVTVGECTLQFGREP
jgi:DNA-binding SARP family transcriptional activator